MRVATRLAELRAERFEGDGGRDPGEPGSQDKSELQSERVLIIGFGPAGQTMIRLLKAIDTQSFPQGRQLPGDGASVPFQAGREAHTYSLAMGNPPTQSKRL